MPNFFIEKNAVVGDVLSITADDARHIARSLRMAEGDIITASDNCGIQYTARLTKIRDELCEAKIEATRYSFGESPIKVTLFMGYPKSDKLELIVQKATELGVSRIVPFESSRCIKRPSGDKTEKITARLSRIAKEAAKQCSRSIIPTVEPILKLDEVLKRVSEFDLALFCYEGAKKDCSCRRALETASDDVKNIAVIVGCEGGFDSTEAEAIVAAGATAVSLGERILRCETAPDFILSAISYRFEM